MNGGENVGRNIFQPSDPLDYTVVPLDWVGVYSLTAPRLGAMYGVRVEAVARRLTEGGARVGLRVALRG